ncbi:unnamed protein product [Dracunculus medinensis]|uniref:All-trans-retinol 13,14-reductase n=1 Tax=Dracunculus medinensis TaxID=318479 RepID=A0A0N4UJ86_DRAME|nr:unnamed protein product [Dracunculus medinensis]
MNCTGISNDRPLIQEEIHQLLHDNFSPSKVNNILWDAIVIGSGLSSLTLSKVLSASGYKVLILEQHDRAGGSCHTFKLDEFEFDVGLHYVQNMYSGRQLFKICSAITDSYCQWQKMDDPVDMVIINGQRYGRTAGDMKEFQSSLKNWFPDESDNIDKFFDYSYQCMKEIPWLFRAKFMPLIIYKILTKFNIFDKLTNIFRCIQETLFEIMSKYNLSPQLQCVISSYAANYGVSPNQASFLQHMLFFMENGYYPIGGANILTSSIIRSINKFGGKVLVKANVREITFDGNRRVNGVIVDYGSSRVFIRSPLVVSTASIVRTFNELIPTPTAKTSFMFSIANELYSKDVVKRGGMQAYIGLLGTRNDLNLPSNNFFWFKTNDIFENSRYLSLKTMDEVIDYGCPPSMYISFPSAKDPGWSARHPNVSTCQIISLANPEWFSEFQNLRNDRSRKRKNKEKYLLLKNTIGNYLVDMVTELFPSIKNEIIFKEFSTPLTQKYYLQNMHGELYSLTHQVDRFQSNYWPYLRIKTDLPGFFCSGQDVLFCGVSSALHSGLLTASSILHRDLYKDLENAYLIQTKK